MLCDIPRTPILNAWCKLYVAGALVFGSHCHAQTVPDKPPASDGQIERVVVTAERRTTTLDTTPAAITVLTGPRLAEQGAVNLADVLNLAPNTSFSSQASTQIFIRGIGNVFLLAGGDPGVALYADGVYLSDQTSTNLALFDTQRIEILRGPQGALYGRNATGGAINLISAPPTNTFQSRIGVEAGNYGRRQAEGFVSGPLGGGSGIGSDTTARLSFQFKDFDGYTKNPLAGMPSGPIVTGGPFFKPPDRLDDLHSSALRLQTSTRLPGQANLRLIAGYYHENDNGPSLPLLIDPLMNSSLLYGLYPEADPRRQASQGAINRIDVRSLQAIYERPLGDGTLSLTTAWRMSNVRHVWDGDETAAPSASPSFITSSIDRSIDLHYASSEEARLRWLAGLTAQDFYQRQDVLFQAQVPLGFLVPGQSLTTAVPGGLRIELGGPIRTRSVAAYTDLRYALTPSLALLGGVRLNRDTKSADEYQRLTVPAFGLGGTNTGNPRDGWTSLSGSVGAEYKLAKDTLTYARLSHGFKSGAVNLGALQGNLVRPETVTALELGLKTKFLDRRGAFNAAVFSSDYKDMQVAQASSTQVILANASRARINGAEFELALRPVPAWLFNATLGLMDPTYSDFTNIDPRNDPTRAVNVSGRQLAQVSRAQLGLGAEYTRTVGNNKLTLRGDYMRRSKIYFTEFNTPDAMQEGYGLLNLAASIQPAAGGWKLYGYVRNATNTTAITSMLITGADLGFTRQVTYTPPREFGIGATVDF
jgi:outer membrane receptor protein involved in Fe transport